MPFSSTVCSGAVGRRERGSPGYAPTTSEVCRGDSHSRRAKAQDDDLHPCSEPRREGGVQPGRSALTCERIGIRVFCLIRTRLTLHPEQRGAKQLFAQYGDRLVCVRYRYDEERKKRVKTVELIVEESDWEPTLSRRVGESLLRVRVALPEVEVRSQVKRAGGRWDPQRRVWELRYDRVVALGLADRIVKDGESIYI